LAICQRWNLPASRQAGTINKTSEAVCFADKILALLMNGRFMKKGGGGNSGFSRADIRPSQGQEASRVVFIRTFFEGGLL
jgi:hypothetical protein